MRKWAKHTSRAALVAAGAVAVGASFGSAGAVANADMRTAGNFSILGGNQVYLPISIPVDVSGNAVSVLGASQAASKGGAKVENGRHGKRGGDMKTSGNFSIGGGNQVKAPISIPVNVCGNAVAVLGLSQAYCKGGAKVENGHKGGHHKLPPTLREGGHHEDDGYRSASSTDRWDRGYGHGGHGRGGDMKTAGNFSILGGNQVYAPISVPVNVCGNAVAVLGLSQAKCKGGAKVERSGGKPDMKTSGNFSILGGNQVFAPISVPVNVCGNAVAVLGVAEAACKGGASVGDGGDHKLPSTLRKGSARTAPGPEQVTGDVTSTLQSVAKGAVGRVAEPVAKPAANQRAAAPSKRARVGETVRGLVRSLKRTAPVTETVGAQPVELLPLDRTPVEFTSPAMR
ncbi:chaplin [Actinomadura sp. WMMB 499]|uniref:chaplin n=1 Tax=Actinomadura sp. WMMB 499 TaxID=1219491 RepID=UPI001246E2C4|nr:chaplin [Actinomadura sp. WMMB 499]QFG23691.1 chaplin [Actinomadura sp. WMMB 499]